MGGIWYLLRHSKARDKWSNIKFFIKVRKLKGEIIMSETYTVKFIEYIECCGYGVCDMRNFRKARIYYLELPQMTKLEQTKEES